MSDYFSWCSEYKHDGGFFKIYCNKHTESIAKAIQVPHQPQQIHICNSLKKFVYRDESEFDL